MQGGERCREQNVTPEGFAGRLAQQASAGAGGPCCDGIIGICKLYCVHKGKVEAANEMSLSARALCCGSVLVAARIRRTKNMYLSEAHIRITAPET